MAELENGILVQHATLGVGKVVALQRDAVHVFFQDGGKRFAAKLRLPAARAFLRVEGIEPNDWLESLSAFTFDEAAGRWALGASFLTHEEALSQFRAVFPAAFEDPAYVAGETGRRTSCWRAAHERFTATLGPADRERLLAADDLKELRKRALGVERAIASLHPEADEDAVKAALAEDDTARPFLAALVELLSVPSPGRARFDRLFEAARALPVAPAQQWLVATLFPFVAAPDRQVLLRPKLTVEAADRLGCELGDTAEPAWKPYSALRALSARLLASLAPHGAKDFVDVESFLHVTATARRRRSTR